MVTLKVVDTFTLQKYIKKCKQPKNHICNY